MPISLTSHSLQHVYHPERRQICMWRTSGPSFRNVPAHWGGYLMRGTHREIWRVPPLLLTVWPTPCWQRDSFRNKCVPHGWELNHIRATRGMSCYFPWSTFKKIACVACFSMSGNTFDYFWNQRAVFEFFEGGLQPTQIKRQMQTHLRTQTQAKSSLNGLGLLFGPTRWPWRPCPRISGDLTRPGCLCPDLQVSTDTWQPWLILPSGA